MGFQSRKQKLDQRITISSVKGILIEKMREKNNTVSRLYIRPIITLLVLMFLHKVSALQISNIMFLQFCAMRQCFPVMEQNLKVEVKRQLQSFCSRLQQLYQCPE